MERSFWNKYSRKERQWDLWFLPYRDQQLPQRCVLSSLGKACMAGFRGSHVYCSRSAWSIDTALLEYIPSLWKIWLAKSVMSKGERNSKETYLNNTKIIIYFSVSTYQTKTGKYRKIPRYWDFIFYFHHV